MSFELQKNPGRDCPNAKTWIVVCTRGTRDSLSTVLYSLICEKQRVIDRLGVNMELVVIVNGDNALQCKGPDRIFLCSDRGLARVRNFAVLQAAAEGVDDLIFVDDDDVVEVDAIVNLLRFHMQNGGEVITSLSAPLSEDPIPRMARPVLCRRRKTARTSGMLICVRRLQRILGDRDWFDVRFDKTGGEDTMFVESVCAHGGAHYVCEDSTLYWIWDEERLTLGHLLGRAAKSGWNKRRIETSLGRWSRHRMVISGAMLCVYGLVSLAMIWWPSKAFKMAYKAAKRAGMLGIVPGQFKRYYE